MSERIAWLIDPDESGLRHVSYREEVVRCRDCGHCRTLPQGCVCDVHGSAGWFATDPNGFCHRAVRMSEKLKLCPFCGKTPELYFDGDDTYVVECKHHDWCKRDEDGTRFAADIAIYAEAESKVNEKLERYVPPHALEVAKRKAIASWNRRADEEEGR